MYDLPVDIDKKDCRTKPVEDIRKGSGFGLPETDHLSCTHSTPHVWRDEFHASTHFVINHARGFAANYRKIGTCRRRFFKDRICCVDPALWLGPFAVEATAT